MAFFHKPFSKGIKLIPQTQPSQLIVPPGLEQATERLLGATTGLTPESLQQAAQAAQAQMANAAFTIQTGTTATMSFATVTEQPEEPKTHHKPTTLEEVVDQEVERLKGLR